MRSFSSVAFLLFFWIGSTNQIFATTVERDWLIVNFQFSGERPSGQIDSAGLNQVSARPRIYSGLVSTFTRVRLANGELLELPGSHPLRLAAGEWRRPDALEAGDRIRYGARTIRVAGVEPVERPRPMRLYVFESNGSRDDFQISAGQLTEDERDLVPAESEERFCPDGTCQQRLGLLYTKPASLAGGSAWFSSFFSIKDFAAAYKSLSSSSLRRRMQAVEWIEQNGTVEQKAIGKLFAHNAGWQGRGLSADQYYRALGQLEVKQSDGRRLTLLEREILRHHFGREVDRRPDPGSGKAVVKNEESPEESGSGPRIDWPAIGRSAVLPGWGNIYRGRTASGYTYAGLFLGSTAFTLYEYNRAVNAAALYKQQALQADIIALALSKSLGRDTMLVQALFLNQASNQTLQAFQRSASNAENGAIIAGLVYATSLLHVTYNSVSWPDPEEPGESAHLRFQPGPAGDSLQFSVVVGF